MHDSSRRAKCAAEVARHDLSLGSERRQWLFDAVATGATATTPISASAESGLPIKEDHGDEPKLAGLATELESGSDAPRAGTRKGLSEEALIAGGDALFADIRSIAPSGYFALRGKAGKGTVIGEGGIDEGLQGESERGLVGGGVEEEKLDWVFRAEETKRVQKGTNTDLVLLEVVMVMLKEQVTLDETVF